MKTILRLALACAGALSLSACVTTTSYVDPRGLQAAGAPTVRGLERPIPVRVDARFEVNGAPAPQADGALQSQIEQALRDSGVFAPSGDPGTAAAITVTVNDTVDLKSAHKKGVHAGLTLGSSGALVPDSYTYNASYASGREAPYRASYRHAILTAVGNNVAAPAEATPTTPADAFHRVIAGMTLRFVRDLQAQGLATR